MTVAKQNGGGDLQHDPELSEESELEREAERLPSLSPYVGNITGYIAGFVCLMVRRRIPCATCHAATVSERSPSAFFDRKNRGGLQKPSSSTIYICQTTEKVIRREDNLHGTSLPKKGNLSDSLTVSVMTELSGHLEKLYPELHDHMFESAADSNHFVRLVKCVIASYIKSKDASHREDGDGQDNWIKHPQAAHKTYPIQAPVKHSHKLMSTCFLHQLQ